MYESLIVDNSSESAENAAETSTPQPSAETPANVRILCFFHWDIRHKFSNTVPTVQIHDPRSALCYWTESTAIRQRNSLAKVRGSIVIVTTPSFLLTFGFCRHVIANDLSPAAVEAMHRNVQYNELGEQRVLKPDGTEKVIPAKVQINEGDAWYDSSSQNSELS